MSDKFLEVIAKLTRISDKLDKDADKELLDRCEKVTGDLIKLHKKDKKVEEDKKEEENVKDKEDKKEEENVKDKEDKKEEEIEYSPIQSYCPVTNLGNSCYLNASLQLLFSIEEFRDAITLPNFDNITMPQEKDMPNGIGRGNCSKLNIDSVIQIFNIFKNIFIELNKNKVPLDATENIVKPVEMNKFEAPKLIELLYESNISYFQYLENELTQLNKIHDSNKTEENKERIKQIMERLKNKDSEINDYKKGQQDAVDVILKLFAIMECFYNYDFNIQQAFKSTIIFKKFFDSIVYKKTFKNEVGNYITEEWNHIFEIQITKDTILECVNDTLIHYNLEKHSGNNSNINHSPYIVKYVMLQLGRFNYDNGTKKINNVNVNRYINIEQNTNTVDHNAAYEIVGCILHLGSTLTRGHYVFLVYKNGKPYKVMDDDKIVDYNSTIHNVEKNGYVFLYKISHKNWGSIPSET